MVLHLPLGPCLRFCCGLLVVHDTVGENACRAAVMARHQLFVCSRPLRASESLQSDPLCWGTKHTDALDRYQARASNTLRCVLQICCRGRRNAGETKGVTMEENKKHLAALRQLLQRPENRACAGETSPVIIQARSFQHVCIHHWTCQ